MKTKKEVLPIAFCIFLLIIAFIMLGNFNKSEDNSKIKIVEEEKFLEICNRIYMVDVYDCSEKAGDFERYLLSKGYDARILVVKWKNNLHALVEVQDGEDKIYLDPTFCEVHNTFPYYLEYYETISINRTFNDEEFIW